MYCPQSRINEKKHDYGILSNVNHYDLLDVVRCFYSTNITYYYQTDYDKKYRFGFNGQEKDDEVAGAGNTNTAMFWEYDTRLGRRWNLDPKSNPSISDYACFGNNPIFMNDVLGDSTRYYYKGDLLFISNDNLRNAVVDLSHLDASDVQLQIIKNTAQSHNLDKEYNSDEFNKKVRSIGVKYYTDDYEKFFDENHGKKNKDGLIAERGFYLKFNKETFEMEMVPNVIIEAQGDTKSTANYLTFGVDPDIKTGKPYEGPYDTHGHIHNSENPPIGTDNNVTSKFYRILINENSIHFFGNEKANPISIPKTDTYKKTKK